jgi:hypothetical protein
VLLQCCKAGIIHTLLAHLCYARLLCLDACMTGVSPSAIHHTATCVFFVLQLCSVLCSYHASRAIILIKNCVTTINKLMQSSFCDYGVIYYNTAFCNHMNVEYKQCETGLCFSGYMQCEMLQVVSWKKHMCKCCLLLELCH